MVRTSSVCVTINSAVMARTDFFWSLCPRVPLLRLFGAVQLRCSRPLLLPLLFLPSCFYNTSGFLLAGRPPFSHHTWMFSAASSSLVPFDTTNTANQPKPRSKLSKVGAGKASWFEPVIVKAFCGGKAGGCDQPVCVCVFVCVCAQLMAPSHHS